jgi:hypothetical protein
VNGKDEVECGNIAKTPARLMNVKSSAASITSGLHIASIRHELGPQRWKEMLCSRLEHKRRVALLVERSFPPIGSVELGLCHPIGPF